MFREKRNSGLGTGTRDWGLGTPNYVARSDRSRQFESSVRASRRCRVAPDRLRAVCRPPRFLRHVRLHAARGGDGRLHPTRPRRVTPRAPPPPPKPPPPLADTIAEKLVFPPVTQSWFLAAARGKKMLVDIGRVDVEVRRGPARLRPVHLA